MAKGNIAEVSVYRDFEKFYKVLGYYEGQEIKPLEVHERHIDRTLEGELRNSNAYIRRIAYEIQMLEAHADKRVVYRTEKPEASLVYSLYSEGIQSLIVLRDVVALDIKEWSELIRQTLKAFDEGTSNKDLASVLWRSPSRNIRTKVYNALLDLEADAQRRAPKKEAVQTKEPSPNWHQRDHEWETPDGEKVQRSEALKRSTPAEKAMGRIKHQMQSMGLDPEIPAELQIDSEELECLSEELSFFDQNHIEFNLLHIALSQLLSLSPQSQFAGARAQSEQLLKKITQGIVGRFQPGLILLLIDSIKQLKNTAPLTALGTELERIITQTLRQPANEKRLISSLKDEERAKTTRKLLPYIDPKQFPAIIDFYLERNDTTNMVEFLKIFFERDLTHESLMFGWGEERLLFILPLFRRLQWPGKYEFIKRLVKSPSQKIQQQACHYMINLDYELPQALDLYGKIADESRENWLQSLIEHPPRDCWKPFLQKAIESQLWQSSHSRALAGKLHLSWLRLALHYFALEAWRIFDTLISARRFWLWPKYTDLRELILITFMENSSTRTNAEFKAMCLREAKTPMQSGSLRSQLILIGNANEPRGTKNRNS